MEEEILKIIIKKTNVSNYSVVQESQAAKEITSHVFEFIVWISESGWNKYKNLDWWVKKDHKIPPKNPPLTLNELYQYWKDNVKDK